MKNSILKKLLVAATAAVAVWTSEAHAVAILTIGNTPQTDENVLLNTGVSGNPIFGTTNQTQLSVRFTGTENITAPANGQARIEAVDGAFTSLITDLPGGTFTSLILNLDATANGTVDFTATLSNGGIQVFNNIAVGGSGANFFTFTTTGGDRYLSIAVAADVPLEFADAAQIRIGGAQRTTSIPDGGATVGLLGGALVVLGMLRRKLNA